MPPFHFKHDSHFAGPGHQALAQSLASALERIMAENPRPHAALVDQANR